MRVLVACEFSGTVRDAFAARGFDAWSCDLLPTERPGQHIQGDVRNVLHWGWLAMIAHPDCTYLTCSAEWAYKDGPYHQKVKPGTLVGVARRQAREDALAFVRELLAAPIPFKALENPRGVIGTRIRKADQTIQPWQFGHDASKSTDLWLERFLPLQPTKIIEPRYVNGRPRWGNQTDSGQNRLPPSENRWKDRARTYQGWADAMAEQWGAQLQRAARAAA